MVLGHGTDSTLSSISRFTVTDDGSVVRADDGTVVRMDKDVGKKADEFRTSLDFRPARGETQLIADLEARAEMLTRIPASHQEPLQILECADDSSLCAVEKAALIKLFLVYSLASSIPRSFILLSLSS